MTARLFVAVDPPAPIAADVVGWARSQRTKGDGLRVVAPDSVHLTLAFLGERPVTDSAAICGAIATAVAESASPDVAGQVPLELGAPAWLPPRHPRALAVEVRDPTTRLAALRDALVLALEDAIGWRAEGRRFRPHLTVARTSGRPEARAPLDPTPAADFAVDAVILYRSFLEPTGARYEALDRVSLVRTGGAA